MKALFALLLLISSSIYAQPKNPFETDPELKAELDKMTPAEREKAAMFMLMMMEAQAGVEKKIYYRAVTPTILTTGKEGFKFKTRIPFLGVAMEKWDFADYKPNPSIREPDYSAEHIISHCMGCFRATKFKDNQLTFTHYPTGSEFTIESFIGVPGHITTIIRDSSGRRIEVNEYYIKEMIDGGWGGMQNEELLLLDHIDFRDEVVNFPVKIEEVAFEYFMKADMDRWDYPPFKTSFRQNFPKEDFDSWLNYAATGFLQQPAKVKVTNIRKTEYDTVFDISTNMRTFVVLLYARLITPYLKIEQMGNFNDQYTSRWKNQTTFALGEKMEDFLKRHKATIKAPPMPEGEERKRIADQLLKEKEAEMKRKFDLKK